MKSAVRRIGVFTSGGDAPGMNAAIRAVVRASLHYGIECIGIRRGYHGLLNGDFTKLDFESVSDISRRGGTMLYSARSLEFIEEAGRNKALATCKLLGMDALVGIGGDGTFKGLLSLANCGISVIGIPGTIDNDIACSSYTIGYDSACNIALDSIDRLRDTMKSHERCSVVEVMGHRAGYLAYSVGIACGATVVLVPERPVDFEVDVIEPIRQARLGGRTHFMVIVAEGFPAVPTRWPTKSERLLRWILASPFWAMYSVVDPRPPVTVWLLLIWDMRLSSYWPMERAVGLWPCTEMIS